MKTVLRLFAPFALVMLFAISSNAQSSTVATATETKKAECKKTCDITKCAKLVAEGKCTKAQMASCAAKCKGATTTENQRAQGLTKVASASVEKTAEGTTKKASPKSCSKVCSSKKTAKKE